jgi:hypothetical protein
LKKSTSSGLDPVTFWLVAYCLNQPCYSAPPPKINAGLKLTIRQAIYVYILKGFDDDVTLRITGFLDFVHHLVF